MNRLLIVGIFLAINSAAASAQEVTTILTHGYGDPKGVWVEGMADAILARADSGGAVCRYRQDAGAWQLVSGALDESEPVVLIFRWIDDFEKEGVNDAFAEAAAEALYAALRDGRFVDHNNLPIAGFDLVFDRDLHFIGHSRGACVNSEVVERLALAGIAVDHVTSCDPHPVNGTLDPPLNFNWGDPTPRTWENVAFADNYWRADSNPFDFDGISISHAHNVNLNESALECCAYSFSHSDTHLWYHGTIDLSQNPCDGEECISDAARNSWWTDELPFDASGYYFSRLGGGSADRPALPPGDPPGLVDSIFNGNFDNLRHAGWVYHGGHLDAAIVTSGGEQCMQFSASSGVSASHNRFFLPGATSSIAFEYRVTVADSGDGDDMFRVILINADGSVEHTVGEIALRPPHTGQWAPVSFPIPGDVEGDRAYRLILEVDAGSRVQSTVQIDDIRLVIPSRAILTGLTVTVGSLSAGTVNDLRQSDDVSVHTRSGFGQTFIDLHNMTMIVAAETDVPDPAILGITIESRINQSAGTALVFLRNWNANRFDQIGSHAVGQTEQTRAFNDIDAGPYVNDEGQIDLQIRHRVFVPIFAFRFDSFFDLVEIAIE